MVRLCEREKERGLSHFPHTSSSTVRSVNFFFFGDFSPVVITCHGLCVITICQVVVLVLINLPKKSVNEQFLKNFP